MDIELPDDFVRRRSWSRKWSSYRYLSPEEIRVHDDPDVIALEVQELGLKQQVLFSLVMLVLPLALSVLVAIKSSDFYMSVGALAIGVSGLIFAPQRTSVSFDRRRRRFLIGTHYLFFSCRKRVDVADCESLRITRGRLENQTWVEIRLEGPKRRKRLFRVKVRNWDIPGTKVQLSRMWQCCGIGLAEDN